MRTANISKLRLGSVLSFCLILQPVFQLCASSPPPVIPIGLDAYRHWELWPYQRIGARAYMRSTYDRRGGNEGADASHFLYQLDDARNVTLDIQAPGLLCFARYNHWHGSPWHYEVDGTDHLVQETSTANPLKPAPDSVFVPARPFPNPLTWTWSQTKGADLSWVPIEFERSFRMAYSRTHYGTGYYIYQQFVPGTKLSHSLHSWDEKRPPDPAVLELLSKAGTDLLPNPNSPEARRLHLQQETGECFLGSGISNAASFELSGPSMLRGLEFSVAREDALEFGRAILRITWDDLSHPSVDAPVALLFGAGTLYNRDNREYLVKAFPVSVRFVDDKVNLACYFPMPFFRHARFELSVPADHQLTVHWRLRWAPLNAQPFEVGYFHATYRDHSHPEPGQDLVLLDTRETEGGGDWSGQFVGTSFIFSDRAVLNTLEGDPRFFFDDSKTPQGQGTGTEEWGGGGDYWGGQNMTLPFAGHPTGARNAKEAKCEEDKIESAYRFLLGDLMPFGRNALIRLEHGGLNDSTEHYQTVTYWYGVNQPSLIRSDVLEIGDAKSEESHRYSSPQASPPYEFSSRYEWGVDTLAGKEIYPAETARGRITEGTSEFTLKLSPDNFGVMLRRKLDYQYPNQRAEVFVADLKDGQVHGSFHPAGVWYLAGGNTCVYSNPKDELGAAQHIAETSNRRLRDDEFLLPKKLTAGRSEVRIRLRFQPVKIPLFPDAPAPVLAWSEIRYDTYCFVLSRAR